MGSRRSKGLKVEGREDEDGVLRGFGVSGRKEVEDREAGEARAEPQRKTGSIQKSVKSAPVICGRLQPSASPCSAVEFHRTIPPPSEFGLDTNSHPAKSGGAGDEAKSFRQDAENSRQD